MPRGWHGGAMWQNRAKTIQWRAQKQNFEKKSEEFSKKA
jgi:hypothetical protein